MKNHWIIVRIVTALIAIFALGIWVGRLTAPSSEVVRLNPQGKEVTTDENGRQRGTPADRVTLQVVKRYRARLNLTKDQLEELRPLFMETGKKMVRFPVRSQERIEILEGFHDQIAPFLSEEQREILKDLPATGRD